MDKGFKPIWACRTSASDEASELEYYLQKQLEDDVASDVYTECNIKHQEAEILQYLKDNLLFEKKDAYYLSKDDLPDENEIFSTPKCLSPFAEQELKGNPLSPNTELTKEYYALVPIDRHTFDQEIGEQDALSNAFQSMINAQAKETIQQQLSPRNKPTSLALTSSHTTKSIQHSNSCDTFVCNRFEDVYYQNENVVKQALGETFSQKKCSIIPTHELVDNLNNHLKTLSNGETVVEKTIEPSYTPDSLITDEPSSSSDYLSATYTCPQGIYSSICQPLNNIGDSFTKMDSTFTPSDSGVENGLLESQSSHRDITLTDLSLTESAIHDSSSDDLKQIFSCANPTDDNHVSKYKYATAQSDKASLSSTSTETSSGLVYPRQSEERPKLRAMDLQSSKEEKQRQNEEIVNLESSSVSSETGSWESIFPPKLGEKAICEQFISQERQLSNNQNTVTKTNITDFMENNSQSLVQKMQVQSASCFIDAASLRDEDETVGIDDNLKYYNNYKKQDIEKSDSLLPVVNETPSSSQIEAGKNDRNDETNDHTEQQPNAESNSFVQWISLEENHKDTSSLKKDFKQNFDASHDFGKTSDTPHNSINVSHPLQEKKSTENEKINNDGNNCSSTENIPAAQEKSSHTFYIDFSSLPDSHPTEDNKTIETQSEKKNMFSMFIDLGETSKLKKIPARLSSLFPARKNTKEKSLIEQTSTASFESCEMLCKDTSLTISEIVAIHNQMESEKQTIIVQQSECSAETKAKPDEVISENVDKEVKNIQNHSDLFVKLSDLDKPPMKTDFTRILQRKSEGLDVRMTRSIPENNWRVSHTSTFRSTEIISSFHSENALSLNRLFPHLKDQLISRSMPGSQGPLNYSNTAVACSDWQDELASYTTNEQTTVALTTVTETTTAISGEELGKLYELMASCQSPLGQDLLRMFIEEIAPDVTVECSGRRIKAHKCILISRCQYFAGILSGSRIEAAGNVIVMPPFSQEVFLFVLCYIYSGISVIPSTINIVELVTLSDMLRLEGLKEAIMLNLKTKYCHHFHSPCEVCIAGVLESFHLSSMYSLDDLYHKCLKWITKYFPVVWPTKAFSSMNEYLVEKCVRALLEHISIETFLDTVFGLGVTMSALQCRKWTKNLERHCYRVMETAIRYAAKNLEILMKELAPSPADAHSSAKRSLEKCMKSAIERAPGEELCRTYVLLGELIEEQGDSGALYEQRSEPRSILYVYGHYWQQCCEIALAYASPRLTRTQAYKNLPYEIKRKLRLLSPQDVLSPIGPVRNRDIYSNPRSGRPQLALPQPMTAVSKVSPNKTMEIKKSPTTSTSAVRTTKAQEQRTKFNMLKKKLTEERDINNRGAVPRNNLSPKRRSKSMETKNEKTDKKDPSQGTSAQMNSSGNSSPNDSAKEKWSSRSNVAGTSRPTTADSTSGAANENMYATYTKSSRTKKEPGERTLPQTKLPTYKYSSISNRYHDATENMPGTSNRLDNVKALPAASSTNTTSVQKHDEPAKKLSALLKPRPNNQLIKEKSGSLNIHHSETRIFCTSPLRGSALHKEIAGPSSRPLSFTVPPKCDHQMNRSEKAVALYNRPPVTKTPTVHKVSGSLTKPTKSSRAKAVTKVISDGNGTSKISKQPVKANNRQAAPRTERPLKNRSRTWSKDEPKDDVDDQHAFQDDH
ncbi:BTB/POZ domain-containing protein 8 [Papilio machaon]|uniref:BTB/POZ domain-containing protein 8 n=1 Tax=Papilio machaon TaxID=76193 RepID=A0A194QLT0_PAPMA|nr:BTB/POZ domain-containing protein 8 [Papilio machaon]